MHCRQEVEELRYEQERLRWQLNQAAHLPTQTLAEQSSTPVSGYCCHNDGDRYIMAKHSDIYPTAEDVSLAAVF